MKYISNFVIAFEHVQMSSETSTKMLIFPYTHVFNRLVDVGLGNVGITIASGNSLATPIEDRRQSFE